MFTQHGIVSEDIQAIIAILGINVSVFENARVLITGGCGFLGRYMTATFLEMNRTFLKNNPCRVIIMDTYITSTRDNIIFDRDDATVTVMEYDVRKAIPDDIRADYIFHMASLASPFYYRKYPIETIEVNVNGTKNLLEYARTHTIKKMLYFSSSEIYGDPIPGMIPMPEAYRGYVSCLGPRACYDESKRMGETLCQVYSQIFATPVTIVRPFNVYGPGGLHAQDFRVVPAFMSSALHGEPLPVHGTGTQTRTFCYMTDAIAGFIKTLLHGKAGEAYNIGQDADEISMNELAKRIADIVSPSAVASNIEYPETYPAGEPQRRCPDLSKAKSELGFHPAVSLSEGLRRTHSWYLVPH